MKRQLRLEWYFGAIFQDNFYACIKKLEISSGKKKESAGKGKELMTSEAMIVLTTAKVGNDESLNCRVTVKRVKRRLVTQRQLVRCGSRGRQLFRWLETKMRKAGEEGYNGFGLRKNNLEVPTGKFMQRYLTVGNSRWERKERTMYKSLCYGVIISMKIGRRGY